MRRTRVRSIGAAGPAFGVLLLRSWLVCCATAPIALADPRTNEERGDGLPEETPGSVAPQTSELVPFPAFTGSRALRLRADSEFLPAAGLETGGEASVYRPGLRLRATIPLSERLAFQAIARYRASLYEFDGAQDFFDVGPNSNDPFDPLHEVSFSLQGALALDGSRHLLFEEERWSLLGELFGAARWEAGAFADGLLGGGGLGVGYEIPGRLELAVGLAVRNRLAESGVSLAPIFSARWRVTDDITLQTRGRGVQIGYALSPGLRAYAAVFRTKQSWRLDGRSEVPGRLVLSDDQLRTGLGVSWRAYRQLRLRLEVGAIARRELEVESRNEDTLSSVDGDPSAYLTLSFDLRP